MTDRTPEQALVDAGFTPSQAHRLAGSLSAAGFRVVPAEATEEMVNAIEDAIADAYAGGAGGNGWTFMGETIPKAEMKMHIVQDPDKMRHLSRIQGAAVDAFAACRPDREKNDA